MKCKVKNNSSLDMTKFMPLLSSFLPYAKKTMGFSRPPSLFFTSDAENAEKPLGKTAFYEPDELKITIFVDKRHPKDIMRSLSHELVHHAQNCRGDFTADLMGETGKGYAQNNDYLREMEREAYEKGNLTFRDWEDTHKKQLQESIYYTKGDNSKMSYKKWRDQEVNSLLMESWGFNAPKNEISHLCAMLVTEKATGRVGHPINHTLLEGGVVTHYDVEFDDVIVEGMPVGALDVEVQEAHHHSAGRRDYDHDEEKVREMYMEEPEEPLDEFIDPVTLGTAAALGLAGGAAGELGKKAMEKITEDPNEAVSMDDMKKAGGKAAKDAKKQAGKDFKKTAGTLAGAGVGGAAGSTLGKMAGSAVGGSIGRTIGGSVPIAGALGLGAAGEAAGKAIGGTIGKLGGGVVGTLGGGVAGQKLAKAHNKLGDKADKAAKDAKAAAKKVKEGAGTDHDGDGDIDSDDYLASKDKAIKANLDEAMIRKAVREAITKAMKRRA